MGAASSVDKAMFAFQRRATAGCPTKEGKNACSEKQKGKIAGQNRSNIDSQREKHKKSPNARGPEERHRARIAASRKIAHTSRKVGRGGPKRQ